MHLACRAEKLLLDAGPIRRFLEVGTSLLDLKNYLGNRALIVPHARTELEVVQNWTGNAPLKLILNASPPWPSDATVPGVDDLSDDIETVRQALAKPGEPQTKHVGEAATIVIGRLLKIPLLGMDDRDARKLGHANGLATVSSGVIAAEMVVRGHFSDDDGLAVFDAATPDQVGASHWTALKQDVAADLATTPTQW